MSSKLKKTDPADEAIAKIIQTVCLKQDGVITPAGATLTALAESAWSLKQAFDTCKEKLEAVHGLLKEQLAPGNTLILPGQVHISLSARETITIPDIKRLYGLLGARTLDLVEERVSYKPMPKLLQLISEPNSSQAEGLRSCLQYTQSVTITYHPSKE